MKMQSTLACACALVAALIATRAPAQSIEPIPELPPRYQIEFIAFSYRDFDPGEELLDGIPEQSAFRTLVIPQIPEQRVLDDALLDALLSVVDEPVEPEPVPELDPFALPEDVANETVAEIPPPPNPRVLLPEELELGAVYARLERLDAYTILFHGGWEQDGMAEDVAVPMPLETLGATNPLGWIRLHMNRFLHVRVDVAYDTAATSEAGIGVPSFGFGVVAPPAPVYHLYEQRRVLRGELNYFDHPAFGVLVVVRLAPERASDDPTAVTVVGPSA